MTKLYFTYPGWKKKAVSFTYDDATKHDRRLVAILNAKRLRGTFNITPSFLGRDNFITKDEITGLYNGHEIASHGFNHLHLNQLTSEELDNELKDGKSFLEDLLQHPVRGFASPFGDHSDHAVAGMKRAGFAYARSCEFTGAFAFPYDPIRWNSTCHHNRIYNNNNSLDLAQKFIDNPAWGGTLLFYNLMGHSYEFENDNNWDLIENIAALLGERDDMWYVTNLEMHDYISAMRSLEISTDGAFAANKSSLPLYTKVGGTHGIGDAKKLIIAPGETVNLEKYLASATPEDEERNSSRKIEVTASFTKIENNFSLAYPGFKRKALTFSYDDAPADDRRFVELINRHGMKGSFNLNTDGIPEKLPEDVKYDEFGYPLYRVTQSEWAELYKGHEIAIHGAAHETYASTPWHLVLHDLESNKRALEAICEKPIRGFAYPCGAFSKTQVSDTILKALDVAYARLTNQPWDKFVLPVNPLTWHPSAHHENDIYELGQKFLEAVPGKEPLMLSIWGHTFEFTTPEKWKIIEDFIELMAGKEEIWYATNIDIFDYIAATRKLEWSSNGKMVFNPTSTPIYGYDGDKPVIICRHS